MYKLYVAKLNAFGCFDDCFNYAAGYFIGKGKLLFTEIFFNHQLTMPYISMMIQKITSPVAIYELLLRHRQFHYFFACTMSILLVLRFGWQFLIFSFIYEPTKFYLFGERFLAEGFIVYPFVYLFASVWKQLHKKALITIDLVFIPIFTWFIVFSREPYTLAALFLFIVVLLCEKKIFHRLVMGGICTGISLGIFMFISFKDFYFNVVTVNRLTVLQSELQNTSIIEMIIKSFFYPIILLFSPLPWNDFHILLSAYTVIGILSVMFVIKKIKPAVFIVSFILLGLSNLRFIPPDTVFYSAFHLLPWYALFITFLILIIHEFSSKKQRVFILILLIPAVVFSLRPSSFFRERTPTSMHEEFLTNYGHLNAVANTIRALSNPDQTIFLDGADELIYWQADRKSSYQYAWYTSVMPIIPIYANARMEMFKNNPPDVYYRFCSQLEIQDRSLPGNMQPLYQQLFKSEKPSCLYIKKSIIPLIRSSQWEEAKKYLYTLPENR
jgi:hypothetical protein